jgi:hypothetical protein
MLSVGRHEIQHDLHVAVQVSAHRLVGPQDTPDITYVELGLMHVAYPVYLRSYREEERYLRLLAQTSGTLHTLAYYYCFLLKGPQILLVPQLAPEYIALSPDTP